MLLEHFEDTYQSVRGEDLYIQGWIPEADNKGVICLVHGLGEHGGRYGGDFVQMFGQLKFSVVTIDLHGHGKSGGKRGHISSYEVLMDDIDILLTEAQKKFSAHLPVFLYGHSMGGNLVLNYALRKDQSLSGLIVSAPWLEMETSPPLIKLLLGFIMSYIWPRFTMGNGIDSTQLTHEEDIKKEYDKDNLVHDRISARLFMEVYKAGKWAIKHADELEIPALILHGTADKITSIDGSREFAHKAGKECRFNELKGYYHELHNENNKELVFSLIKEWILAI